jgi:hypothetical protein
MRLPSIRPSRFSALFALLLGLLALSAAAQDKPGKLEDVPEPPPPPPNLSADPELEPEVVIRDREDGGQAVEYRRGGRLYMVKIVPKVGKPYYLIDNRGDGVFTRYDDMDSGLKVPQWIVHEW